MYSESEQQIIDQAIAIITKAAVKTSTPFTSPKLVKDYISLKIASSERELFFVMFLTTQHTLIKGEVLFMGTINGCEVQCREVMKRALQLNAEALIFCHNHPSGNVTPSRADEFITERLVKSAELLDIRVLDHIIVTQDGKYTSFAEEGRL